MIVLHFPKNKNGNKNLRLLGVIEDSFLFHVTKKTNRAKGKLLECYIYFSTGHMKRLENLL